MKLSFANGPGYNLHKNKASIDRIDPLKFQNLNGFEFESPATLPRAQETHGGDDVAIYAKGPYAHLFTGSMEQNAIPHLMAFATCVGEGITACKSHETDNVPKNTQ